jgi:hypothetical protein
MPAAGLDHFPYPGPMLPPTLDPRGLLGNAVTGYELAWTHRRQRRDAAGTGERESADLDAVDARLTALAADKPLRSTAWISVVVLAAGLLPAGTAAANPYGAPAMSSHSGGPPGGAMAVAWPSGQHPIIVSGVGVRFCDDDPCTRYAVRNGGPPVIDGNGTAGIAADGTVIKAALTGGQDTGGPFIHYGRCARQDGCHEAWMPARASAEEPFAWSELAVSSAPDGAIWFALATPPAHDQPGRARVEFKLIRCADINCVRPERHVLGTVAGTMDPNSGVRGRGRLSIGADGRPVASFRIEHAVHIATCELSRAPIPC